MFACAITANICYGLGILIRANNWDVVRSSAPWILGSLGTVTLDLVIFTQVMSILLHASDNCQSASQLHLRLGQGTALQQHHVINNMHAVYVLLVHSLQQAKQQNKGFEYAGCHC